MVGWTCTGVDFSSFHFDFCSAFIIHLIIFYFFPFRRNCYSVSWPQIPTENFLLILVSFYLHFYMKKHIIYYICF